uniref:HlyD family efflux transporter periplasmic adaptor subunit n=1 Tax=Acetatifactor sp. TaxID=1872090 RepID=UPI004057815E
MKPIIIDMKDMSDSTEVYDAKPNPVLAGFIYLILAMVVVAFIWMYCCKMDIVVKGTGTVAAADEVATVTNQVAGVITERRIEDGQEVKAGDILYIVSCEEQALQLETLKQQLADCVAQEEMLHAYEEWLEVDAEFPAELTDNIYYAEISARKNLVELGQESTRQTYTGELAAYDAKLYSNEGMLAYYNNAVDKANQLIEAVRSRQNSFAREETYYWNTVENYLIQYQQIVNQYDNQINELQNQKETAENEIEMLEAQKQTVQEQLNEAVGIAAVSGGDANAVTLLQQEMQALETQLVSQNAIKENAEKSINQYQVQKSFDLNACEQENITAIENSILGYEQNRASYEGVKQEYVNGQNTLMEQGMETELENLVTQEKRSVAAELENCRQSQLQLEGQIENMEQIVENATVRASMDGTINLAADLVEGNYLTAGTQVLSIIPDTGEGAFSVKSYVENKDIAKISEGMKVTYEIGAYPSREYGTMTGEVTFVSADLKVNNSGSAYYVVETSVDAGDLRNRVGEEANLKVGMLCETRIVVEEKRVLEVLIEKLFHI